MSSSMSSASNERENLLSWSWRQLLTMHYFTKSDIKTTIIPVAVFAAFAAPFHNITDLVQATCWTWVHLLQFDIANQCINPEEDKLNKPDRPLASGRISLEDARRLRWILVPVCIAYSAMYSHSVAIVSLALALLIIAYNELGIHAGHWFIRNSTIGLGYGMYEAGATLIAGKYKNNIDSAGTFAVLASIGIIATTYHVQDFKDFEGDRAIGRKTFPIVMPALARQSLLAILTGWSLYVCYMWRMTPIISTLVCSLGLYVGLRFLTMKTLLEDQKSFYWYNAWLTVVHCLPGIWRVGSLVHS